MYKNKLPEIGEIVFVKLETSDIDNTVELVDYNLKGLILCTEISKYKTNLKGIEKLNSIFPTLVLGIYNDGKSIDLSYSKIKYNTREMLKNCHDTQTKFYNFINNKLHNKLKTHIKIDEIDKIDKIDEIDEIVNFIDKHITPMNYTESVIQNNNIIKDIFNEFLLKPESFTNSTMLIDHVKTKIFIKPNECIVDFKLYIHENQSLIVLKNIFKNIKDNLNNLNNYEHVEITCRSSPFYQIKLINNDIEIIENNIISIKEIIKQIVSQYNCVLEFDDTYKIIKKMNIEIK